ncbi:TetR/AcrR family transcriptional regulator [Nocardia sp. XZ_19_385]|uniref:TetR/AcrR family transcriptional regulator n=1 Tax=Nocardia sp. XZ_19_385 TaxID=2769488 RepID=UPI0018908B93|nr:TetR/AcrR family transcriptional regulator [Nocardia sp. XZ_19_385]
MTASKEPRRRADAERSRAAILDAAIRLLAEGVDTGGLAAVAEAAGVTRQTVYAHFANREELFAAVGDRIRSDTVTALEAADLDTGPAPDALLRILDLSWRAVDLGPLKRRVSPGEPSRGTQTPAPVYDNLLRLLRRGQDTGEFDSATTPQWLAATLIAVTRAARAEVEAGRMTRAQAEKSLHESALRLVGAPARSR